MFRFIGFDLDSELTNLLLMGQLSPIELFNICKIQLLSLNTAHLFPDAESLIDKLFIKTIGCSHEEFLSKLNLFHPQPPTLEAVIFRSRSSYAHEPSHSLLDVVCALKRLYLLLQFVEVVAQASSLDQFVTQGGTVSD